ncbi:carbohydrate ABC transporter permease [Aquibaculum arenosum]|uniref:Sugar ABC transporter permease n=1 Tax=Aquibaculum arenosum TaxID=3032591 RepID=A0ABT5YIG5_9PROT|nr:sugar ABC transporter permease [Fodinicurvata sp. CAU 1616]MDF2094631.1 sugar ABC transporter permease [Fodinicurvata sp. CAU 1616]
MPRLKTTTLYGWLLFAPAGVMLTLFAFSPTIATFWQSLFSRGTARRPSQFIGLDNYEAMLADPIFWQVAKNSLWYAVGTIPTSIAIALGMALWVNSKLPARTLVRMAYFTPTILPMIAAANIWLFFYTPNIGLLDQMGRALGLGGHNWLGDPSTALGAIIVTTVWKEAGFFMIFYLAALQTIPPDLKDAAAIEGAGRWTWFRRVVFPLLMPTTLFVLVNAMINSVKLIDHLFILTKGGPSNASKLLLYYVYETAFSYFDQPYAATLTVVILLTLGLLAVVQVRGLDRRIHYR